MVSFWRWREIRGSLESLAQAPTSPHFPVFCSKEQQSGDERTQLLKQTSGPHRGSSAHPPSHPAPTHFHKLSNLLVTQCRSISANPSPDFTTSQAPNILEQSLENPAHPLTSPHNLRTHPSPVALVRRLMVAAVYSSGLRWYRHQRAPHCLLPR